MQKSAYLRSVTVATTTSESITTESQTPRSRNALLLQGPVGPFFSRFAEDLSARGFRVTKVNFNGGDRFFYRRQPSIDYSGKVDDWEAWLERLLVNCRIGRIYLFGDCRCYHRAAITLARRLDVKVYVFEEGYIRPNFITLEQGGVNGHSSMMQRPFSDTMIHPDQPEEKPQPRHVFLFTAVYSMMYYLAVAVSRRQFADYRHHRPVACLVEGLRWIRSGLRKRKYARQEKSVLKDVITQYQGNYFVCPLQVHCDMQVIVHSDFNSIEHFVGDVLASFREHAQKNKAIVFKHHPLDRGYTDYALLFDSLVAELGLHGRVFYVHDVCLPTLLKHAQGTVLINSTVGLSSLFHGTPVKTLGKAIYDVPGLTEQCPLDEFWSCERSVNRSLFKAFRSFLINRSQINGNFYRRVSDAGATGTHWSDELISQHTWQENPVHRSTSPNLTVVSAKTGSTYKAGDNDAAKAA